jgi:hypothetical protein
LLAKVLVTIFINGKLPLVGQSIDNPLLDLDIGLVVNYINKNIISQHFTYIISPQPGIETLRTAKIVGEGLPRLPGEIDHTVEQSIGGGHRFSLRETGFKYLGKSRLAGALL